MQEEVQQKILTLSFKAARLSGTTLKKALTALLDSIKNKHQQNKTVQPQGKQKIKDLVASNQSLTKIDVNDGNIKDFDKFAKKYHIDYSVMKDKATTPPTFYIFFKAKDTEVLTQAFKEYTQYDTKKQEKKANLHERLEKAKEKVKSVPVKIKNREIGER